MDVAGIYWYLWNVLNLNLDTQQFEAGFHNDMKTVWRMDNQVSDLKKEVPNDAHSIAPGKEGKETVKGTVKEWAANSSTHGISSLERSRHLARRLF